MIEPPDNPPSGLPQHYVGQTLPQLYQPTAGALPPPRQTSLKDYLYILRRRKWLPVAVTLTVLALSALQVFTTTPKYTAASRVQINPGEADILPYQDIAGPGRGGASEQFIWTQAEKLKSRDLAARVIERLDLANNRDFNARPSAGAFKELSGSIRRLARAAGTALVGSPGPPIQQTTVTAETDTSDEARPPQVLSDRRLQALEGKLISNIRISPLRRTRLIEVGYVSQSPALASQVANTIADEFILLHLQNRYDATIRATRFLEGQLAELKSKVESSEASLLDYAQRKNIIAVSGNETVNRKRFADLSDEKTRLFNEMVAAQARYEAVRNAPGRSLPESFKDERIRSLEGRLSELEGELAGYSSRYGPEWPAVKQLRSQSNDLRAQLETARREAISSAEQNYQLARNRHNRIASTMTDQQQVVDLLDDDSIEYNILKREVESNKALYQGLLQRLKEATVAAGLEPSNIQVADRAITPSVASSPKKTQSLIRALLLGLLLGLASVVLAENLDNTVKTPDDIDHFIHLPSLGIIPALFGRTKLSLLQRLLRRKAETPAPDGPVLLYGREDEAHSAQAWEAYRSLRTSIMLSSPAKEPQALLITSAIPGEGKSTTALNLAVALAQTGGRTLLLDLDLRRPKLGKALGLKAIEGMSTYLTGHASLSTLIQPTGVANLYAVAAGPHSPNPPELLGSERMRAGLTLARDFTHVVIDSPPCLELSDAVLLSLIVDGVILVARAGKTPRHALIRARDQLLRARAPLLGVALNSVDIHSENYSYYGGYYSTYHGSDGELTAKRTA